MKNACRFFLALSLLIFAVNSYPQSAATLAERTEKAISPISGELKIRGLTKTVQVFRDNWGVAHIHAENQHDLFFAQGFVAAQDRLFQMEMWKRAGQRG